MNIEERKTEAKGEARGRSQSQALGAERKAESLLPGRPQQSFCPEGLVFQSQLPIH